MSEYRESIMVNIIKNLFTSESPRERGRKYAESELREGTPAEVLSSFADNPFDFNDFDRGVLDAIRAIHRENQS